jgi:hypothetical protein
VFRARDRKVCGDELVIFCAVVLEEDIYCEVNEMYIFVKKKFTVY